MSLSNELRQLADTFSGNSATEVAVGLLKEAGLSDEEARIQVLQMEMEKTAAEQLVMQGIDVERAVALVKSAKIDVKSLTKVDLTPEECPEKDLLNKVASYIEELESKVTYVDELESKISDMEKAAQESSISEVELPEVFTKAATAGMLTKEDLDQIRSLDRQLIEKVASSVEKPWEMGSAYGVKREKTDPILEFCLS